MITKNEIKTLIVIAILFAVILLVVTIGLNLFAYGIIGNVIQRNNWREKTTPLPERTIQVLCKNLALDDEHSLCNGNKHVYGPDFYSVIRETLLSETGDRIFYDDVERMLGEFKTECDAVEEAPEGWSYFRCSYDLRGDGQFIFGIMYSYPQNEVFDVLTPMTNSF